MSIQQRRSFPIRLEQVFKSEEEKPQKATENAAKTGQKRQQKQPKSSQNKTAQKAPQSGHKHQGGRPKGSKNKNKTAVTFTPELLRIKGWIQACSKQLSAMVPLTYLLLDGHERQ